MDTCEYCEATSQRLLPIVVHLEVLHVCAECRRWLVEDYFPYLLRVRGFR